MPTYAILGSTGNCGTALTKNLLKSPDNRINAYCRNVAKLHSLIPEVIDSKDVQVFSGSITDVELMEECVRDTQAVFMVATTNDNIPGCRISQDSAATVITALKNIKAKALPGLKLPTLVLLSSATIDPYLSRNMPSWFLPIMLTAASYVYEDLKVTEQIMRAESSWLSSIFIKPAGLSPDVSRGHRLTLDEEESFISYLDLSAGMIEAVQDPENRYCGRNVGVVNAKRGVGAKFPSGTPKCILMGLMRHFFPWLHPYLPTTGPA
ncbi:putative NAD-dependent epimerase/dehydratase [Plenodomus tracheiphilus IPT5]|uniref:Putative NAD-dependent epimerase/dehydratase n=1 Tax=Plenodomus tracheiphilus IPT5 TaxID=1408161 RepID=A0A6A7ANY1_9PLEO|nr:putative NAD-dependent epimerase/dehydratase [Plenodomus tracheiphilus IPT5]